MHGCDALLEGLTQAQREAVTAPDGPMLVLAGPGSGKATVVTRRIAALLARGTSPWSIRSKRFSRLVPWPESSTATRKSFAALIRRGSRRYGAWPASG